MNRIPTFASYGRDHSPPLTNVLCHGRATKKNKLENENGGGIHLRSPSAVLHHVHIVLAGRTDKKKSKQHDTAKINHVANNLFWSGLRVNSRFLSRPYTTICMMPLCDGLLDSPLTNVLPASSGATSSAKWLNSPSSHVREPFVRNASCKPRNNDGGTRFHSWL